jgi:hypothetical protein
MGFQATTVQKKLEDAGFETRLAYGITAVLERDVVGELEDKIVTKDFLDSRLDAKIAELLADMIKWMAGLVGGSTLAIIMALLRLAK